jgi:glucosamine kinase
MRLALGFDGGGTKTECVLMDENHLVLTQSRSGPSNPMRIGFAAALAAICEASRLALQQAGVSADNVATLCAGLGGTGQPQAAQKMKDLLRAEFPGTHVHLCTDLDLTLEAAGDGPAIVLVAGTGSAAVGRDAQGCIARVGGHGPIHSDEGSAYDIGRRAAAAEMREFEENSANSPLGEHILSEFGFASWQELQARASSAPDDVFPKIFPVVAAAADEGNFAAREHLEAAATELGRLAKELAERLQLRQEKFLLVRCGGMIGRSAYFDQQIDQRLREAAAHAEFGVLAMTPAEAAALIALRLLSEPRLEGNYRSGI